MFRNVRLDSVLVDREGYPKLGDFGRARFASGGGKDGREEGGKDLENLVNVQYLPPEVLSSSEHDHMADYWSLGVCVQYMLTGKVGGRLGWWSRVGGRLGWWSRVGGRLGWWSRVGGRLGW